MTRLQDVMRKDAARHDQYRRSGAWQGRTIADNARDWAMTAPDTEVFLNEPRPITYSDLLIDAEALAVALWQMGLRPGDVISFQLPNWVEAAVINLTASLLGLVINPIVPIYRDSEVRIILEDCRSKALFIPSEFRNFNYLEMATQLKAELGDLDHIITVRANAPAELTYEDLVTTGRGGNLPWPQLSAESLKLVMYTSGTTGRPKGVLHSHNTLARAVQASVDYWGIEVNDVILMPSPITHISGYSNGIEMPFLQGTRSVLMPFWNAEEAVGLADRYGMNATVGATPFLQELVAAAEAAGSRIPSLKAFACGGAAVPPALIRRANNTFANHCAFRVYGSTEAPYGSLGYTGAANSDLAADTDGRIVDYEVRIVDDHDNPLPEGQDGEILLRGPALFLGYSEPAHNADSFTDDGFFRTGDIGHIVAGDGLRITGRKKDLIIRGGENISAKEVEDLLHRHPDIVEAAVVAMPHERLGEGICAFVIPRPGATIDLPAITAYLAESRLAKQKYPEHVEIVADLPRTASGKVKKDILRTTIANIINKQT